MLGAIFTGFLMALSLIFFVPDNPAADEDCWKDSP
jgi:hypothetical protein